MTETGRQKGSDRVKNSELGIRAGKMKLINDDDR